MPSPHRMGALCCLALVATSSAIAGAQEQERPRAASIVMILTDDEDLRAHAHMPKTKALIKDQGASLPNYFATSLCAPVAGDAPTPSPAMATPSSTGDGVPLPRPPSFGAP